MLLAQLRKLIHTKFVETADHRWNGNGNAGDFLDRAHFDE